MAKRNTTPPPSSRLLLPRVLLGSVAVLTAAVAVLGVLLFLGVNGNGTTVFEQQVTTCKVGTDPGCVLRQPIHEHANFALIIDGKKFDFDQPQFLSTDSFETSPYAHIHAPRYDIVHVHYSNTTWNEFFKSIGFNLVDPSFPTVTNEQTCLTLPTGEKLCGNDTKKFHFIVNGVKVDGVASKNIYDLDRVLIVYGTETDDQAMALFPQVGDDACIPSERCSDRIGPDEEAEPCRGAGACTG
jgi:hypothetical protein